MRFLGGLGSWKFFSWSWIKRRRISEILRKEMVYRNIVNKSNLQDPTAFPMDTNKPGYYEMDDSVSFERGPSKNGRLWIFPLMVSIGWADQTRKKK